MIVGRGAPIDLRFTVDHPPDEIELRLYPSAGAAASFMRWPEELPTGLAFIDQSRPESGIDVRYAADIPPGAYSLVVRASWGEDVSVFYAISFLVPG